MDDEIVHIDACIVDGESTCSVHENWWTSMPEAIANASCIACLQAIVAFGVLAAKQLKKLDG
jgi:hypothetical protein